MEDNKDMVGSTATEQKDVETKVDNIQQVETPAETKGEKKEKLYTRKEVEAIKAAERKAIEDKYEAEKNEAEKLAKLDDDAKKDYALQKETERANKAESELNAYKLKDTAIDIAREKGVDEILLDLIDFTQETAESVSTKIETISTTFKTAVEKAVNERLKEKSPKTVVGSEVTTTGQGGIKLNPMFKSYN